LEGNGRGLF